MSTVPTDSVLRRHHEQMQRAARLVPTDSVLRRHYEQMRQAARASVGSGRHSRGRRNPLLLPAARHPPAVRRRHRNPRPAVLHRHRNPRPAVRAGTGARGHRSRRRLLRLAQEVVRRLKPAPRDPLPGPPSGTRCRPFAGVPRLPPKHRPSSRRTVSFDHDTLGHRRRNHPAGRPPPFRSRGAVHRIREGVSAAARASIPFCPPHGREHARPEDREGAGQNVHGAVEALADERPERHRDQGGE